MFDMITPKNDNTKVWIVTDFKYSDDHKYYGELEIKPITDITEKDFNENIPSLSFYDLSLQKHKYLSPEVPYFFFDFLFYFTRDKHLYTPFLNHSLPKYFKYRDDEWNKFYSYHLLTSKCFCLRWQCRQVSDFFD